MCVSYSDPKGALFLSPDACYVIDMHLEWKEVEAYLLKG